VHIFNAQEKGWAAVRNSLSRNCVAAQPLTKQQAFT
jgi:hypothetical protein